MSLMGRTQYAPKSTTGDNPPATFSPEGDLKFSMGRFSMNANDYARDWYSCDEPKNLYQEQELAFLRAHSKNIPIEQIAEHLGRTACM